MDPRFFNFIDPVLKYIDSGSFFRQPFKWLYYIIGVLNFAIPVSFIVSLSKISKYAESKMVFCMILFIIISLVLAYICCLLWIKRASSLNTDASKGARFIAIPIMANFIQTLGEWFGAWIGIGGFIFSILALLMGAGRAFEYMFDIDINFLVSLIFIVAGYLTVVIFRFWAELFLCTASIANSAQSIDNKLEAK